MTHYVRSGRCHDLSIKPLAKQAHVGLSNDEQTLTYVLICTCLPVNSHVKSGVIRIGFDKSQALES